MEQHDWEKLYNDYQPALRPANPELIRQCSNTEFCTNCQLRCGCPIRIMFYMEPMQFELMLQTSEIQTFAYFRKQIPTQAYDYISEKCYDSANHLRKKQGNELSLHHFYSFT